MGKFLLARKVAVLIEDVKESSMKDKVAAAFKGKGKTKAVSKETIQREGV